MIETFVVKPMMHGEEVYARSGPLVSVIQVMPRCVIEDNVWLVDTASKRNETDHFVVKIMVGLHRPAAGGTTRMQLEQWPCEV